VSLPKLVVVDIGSTLVRASSGHPARRIGTELGLTSEQQRVLNCSLMTRPFTSSAAVAQYIRHDLGILDSRVDAVVAGVWTAQEVEAEPVDGALDALAALHDNGFRLSVLSNIWQPYLDSVRRHFGDLFDEQIPASLQLFSFRVGEMKPARSLFERVATAAGVGASDAVMVGDSYDTDLRPAMEIGMRTVWVLQRPEREVGAIVAVLNGEQPGPTTTVPAFGALTAELVASLWPIPAGMER